MTGTSLGSKFTDNPYLAGPVSVVPEGSSVTLEKCSELAHIPSDLPTMLREWIVLLAGPRSWSDTRESWLSRAARNASITPRQAKSLFYMESDNPSGVVVFNVLRAVDRLNREADAWSRPAGGNQ